MDEFEQFLKAKQMEAKLSNKVTVDMQMIVDHFIERVSTLFIFIEDILEPFIADKTIVIERRQRHIIEEDYGEYDVQELIIDVSGDKVHLTPVGANIIGAVGRIDMRGPQKSAVMLLTREAGPQINTYISPHEAPQPEAITLERLTAMEWQFLERVPRSHYLEFSPDSFKQMLMRVING
ncbi:hypothetical protein NST38_30650 [Paenibacillus sp. FSL H8-0104]|uniref:hypothetical protein n=1 Tax=Paenibacillus sp. FSL H8-0104 TaxID=2954509 RepID=UPI0030FD5D32